jgi:hypothetical protein
VNYLDVASNADVAATITRLNEVWAQAAVRFSCTSRVVKPVRNIIAIFREAARSGTFSIRVNGVTVPPFELRLTPWDRSPLVIAERIVRGVNAVIGTGRAEVFDYSSRNEDEDLAFVVIDRGSDVSLTNLKSTVFPTSIWLPEFSTADATVGSLYESVCLAANYGDRNKNTIDFFIVKELEEGTDGQGNPLNPRGLAWTTRNSGTSGEMLNTAFIELSTADNAPDDPHTVAHEAGRFLMDYSDLSAGTYDLMNTTALADSIWAQKRLTPAQHERTRVISDGTLLLP